MTDRIRKMGSCGTSLQSCDLQLREVVLHLVDDCERRKTQLPYLLVHETLSELNQVVDKRALVGSKIDHELKELLEFGFVHDAIQLAAQVRFHPQEIDLATIPRQLHLQRDFASQHLDCGDLGGAQCQRIR